MNEFKKISDVDVINSLTDNDNVVIIGSDGVIRQTSSSNLGMDITKTEVIDERTDDDKFVVVSGGKVKQMSVENFDIVNSEIVEAPEEDDTLVLVSNGEVKQVSAATFAAASGGGGVEPILVVPSSTGGDYWMCKFDDGSDLTPNLYDLFIAGTPIFVAYSGPYAVDRASRFLVTCARVMPSSSSTQCTFYFQDFIDDQTRSFSINL